MAALHVRIVAPDRMVYEGDATAMVIPAWDGKVGILPGHAPMIALLGVGELAVDKPGGGSVTVHVAGGVAKVEDDGVTVVTEYAGPEPPTELPDAVVHPEEVQVATRTSGLGWPLV